jgi:hypothetical protein
MKNLKKRSLKKFFIFSILYLLYNFTFLKVKFNKFILINILNYKFIYFFNRLNKYKYELIGFFK